MVTAFERGLDLRIIKLKLMAFMFTGSLKATSIRSLSMSRRLKNAREGGVASGVKFLT